MNVFLSWSGNESKQLASIFKEWLPNVLQFVEPYMSSQDIALGERWSNNITDNLEESTFGLIFVTPTNINAPWLNYEAGALSKTYNSKVIPVLYKSELLILQEGPLKQFQSSTNLEKESIYSLISSINNSYEERKLEKERLEISFAMWWPELEVSISKITDEENTGSDSEFEEPSEKELLNVIFSKLVEQEKAFSRERHANNRIIERNIPPELLFELDNTYKILKTCKSYLIGGPFDEEFFKELDDSIDGLKKAMTYLKRISVKNRTKYENK